MRVRGDIILNWEDPETLEKFKGVRTGQEVWMWFQEQELQGEILFLSPVLAAVSLNVT